MSTSTANPKPSADKKSTEETILCTVRPMFIKPGILSCDDPGHNNLKTFIDLLDTTATEKEQRLKVSPFRAVGNTFDFSDPAKCHLPNVWQFADQLDLARLYDAVFRINKQPDFIKAANLQIYMWFPQRGPQPSKKPNFHHLIDIRNFTLYGWCGCLPRDDPKTSRTLILTTDRMFEDCPHWSKYPATPVQPTPGSHATAPQGPPPTRIGVINGHFPHGVLYPPPPEDESPNVVPHHIYGGILSNDRPAWPESAIVPREIYLSSSTAQK
ncbi:hypothetical protein CSOJ01_16039 [Colletotrichum sojae]|uniref:Uncharacterized protein n=1 Tax=Colletotrichum sojae TaxID=2175907 RepID=A0A8H6MHK3_9PEZI|nr:hypothetical protein CSOJ01_16039 [Colletotrichum sojae]